MLVGVVHLADLVTGLAQASLVEADSWPSVALALVNMMQTVMLAWLASEQVQSRRERHRRQREEGHEEQ